MIITQTPLRISFLGGGTDYPEYFTEHGGAVVGTAIDKFVYFNASSLYSGLTDYSIRVSYRKVEMCNSLDEMDHAPFRECMRSQHVTNNVEINHTADIPAFTGLGSSSSFVVGLLKTLASYKGRTIDPLELAYRAIEIERNVLKEPVGCQDQTFAAVGGLNMIEFRALDDISVHRLPVAPQRLADLESHLMLFFTGIKRRAEIIERRQVQRINQNLDHLAELRKLVDRGTAILLNGCSITKFGELLHEAWLHKRQLDTSITNERINQIYQQGLAAGAIGGKLLGAGGGGFMLFFVPPDKQPILRQRLSHLREVPVHLNAPGAKIIPPHN